MQIGESKAAMNLNFRKTILQLIIAGFAAGALFVGSVRSRTLVL